METTHTETSDMDTPSIIKKASIKEINSFKLEPFLIDLLWEEPFYSRILRSLSKNETNEIPTAGVSVIENTLSLFWNRIFFANLKHKEVLGILKHECLHIIFKHIIERK
jgi:predicted metal-dependent peptidase